MAENDDRDRFRPKTNPRMRTVSGPQLAPDWTDEPTAVDASPKEAQLYHAMKSLGKEVKEIKIAVSTNERKAAAAHQSLGERLSSTEASFNTSMSHVQTQVAKIDEKVDDLKTGHDRMYGRLEEVLEDRREARRDRRRGDSGKLEKKVNQVIEAREGRTFRTIKIKTYHVILSAIILFLISLVIYLLTGHHPH